MQICMKQATNSYVMQKANAKEKTREKNLTPHDQMSKSASSSSSPHLLPIAPFGSVISCMPLSKSSIDVKQQQSTTINNKQQNCPTGEQISVDRGNISVLAPFTFLLVFLHYRNHKKDALVLRKLCFFSAHLNEQAIEHLPVPGLSMRMNR